jgi:hypothetical protein
MKKSVFKDMNEWVITLSDAAFRDKYPPSIHLDKFYGYPVNPASNKDLISFGCAIFEQCLSGIMKEKLTINSLKIMLSYEIGSSTFVEMWNSSKLENIPPDYSSPELLIVQQKNFFYPFIESYHTPIDIENLDENFGAIYSCSRPYKIKNENLQYSHRVTLYMASDT